MDDVPRRPDAIPPRLGAAASYYAVAALFIAFGIIGILTIGLPFLIVGVLLLALAPYRRRPEILWPPLVAVAVWTAAETVLAPWGCSQSGSGSVGSSGTRTAVVSSEICRTVFGLRVSSSILAPALIALAVAVVAAVATRVVLSRRATTRGA